MSRNTFEKLHYETVSDYLREVLIKLMKEPLFDPFRLVGGTALSLQLGHRVSIDIDLFTDASYGSISFEKIDQYLQNRFSYFSYALGPAGMGRQYIVGSNETESIKLDLYYTDKFVFPSVIKDGIRMASVEEITAMKMNILPGCGRKKDFWDIHELLDIHPVGKMFQFHKLRHPYEHEEDLLIQKFVDFSKADAEPNPECLHGKHWEVIRTELAEELEKYLSAKKNLLLRKDEKNIAPKRNKN